MGMFDTVAVECPQCAEFVGVQSKAMGHRLTNLNLYNIENAPDDIKADIADCQCECRKCGQKFTVRAEITLTVMACHDFPPDTDSWIVWSEPHPLCKDGGSEYPDWYLDHIQQQIESKPSDPLMPGGER